jgi:hypothetical protein
MNWKASAVVVPAVTTAAGGAWALYTFYYPAPAKVEITKTIQYRVCMGENPIYCPPHNAFVVCYTDLDKWARAKCDKFSRFTSRTSQNRRKSKCGYSITDITCTAKK